MKIVAISDTHGLHRALTLPSGDILICAGDMQGWKQKLDDFFSWIGAQPFKYKILIAGNHDEAFEKNADETEKLLLRLAGKNVHYLMDREVTIEGLRIYGSPWTPEFNNWFFNVPRDRIAENWAHIPKGLDVLITHGPPSGKLGGVLEDGEDVGDEALLQRVLKVRPRLHVFGHIHSGYGVIKHSSGVTFANAAMLDEKFGMARKPLELEL